MKEHPRDHGRPQPALALFTQLRGPGLTNPDAVADEVRHFSWLCMVLEVLVVARLGQFAKAGELADRALATKQPAKWAFGHGQATKQVLGWVRLMRLGAELGAAANSGGELRGRWRQVRESLDAKAVELSAVPGLQHYAALEAGLIAGADPNAAVDEAVVGKLDEAQRFLPFGRTAEAVERAVADLRWRQQVVDKFWQLIRSQQFGPARQLYAEHLEPTDRVRTPPALEFARRILDTEDGNMPADKLPRRAQMLQSRAAAELSPATTRGGPTPTACGGWRG